MPTPSSNNPAPPAGGQVFFSRDLTASCPDDVAYFRSRMAGATARALIASRLASEARQRRHRTADWFYTAEPAGGDSSALMRLRERDRAPAASLTPAAAMIDTEPESGAPSRSGTASPRPPTTRLMGSTSGRPSLETPDEPGTATTAEPATMTATTTATTATTIVELESALATEARPHRPDAGHVGVASRANPDPSSGPSSRTVTAKNKYSWDPDPDEITIPSIKDGFTSIRVHTASPSCFLRAGSRYRGMQKSERQVYSVEVEIKQVDLGESYLCGYLRINGLTPEHPSLTTFFEGEIIGPKYGFATEDQSWGANERIDHNHWSKFTAFRPLLKQARRGSSSSSGGGSGSRGRKVVIRDVAQHEHIFMRWKERFLVPDHKVRTIEGASFEGFYYICFNQIKAEISGIYFHSKSERFQQLELRYVEEERSRYFSSIELR